MRRSASTVTWAGPRVRVLQRFDRRVERIRHVGMDARYAIAVGSRARPTRNCFVVCVRLTVARIHAANGQVVHGARTCRWNPVGNHFGKGPQQDIGNALRGFDVTARHRRGEFCIDNRPFRQNQFHWPHESGSSRRFLRQQTAQDIERR